MACIWKTIEKNNFFPVNTISRDWIIWNKKIKNILLVLEILQVLTSSFFAHLVWKIFGVCLKRKNRKQKKKRGVFDRKTCYKNFFFQKIKKTRRQYLINRFMKKCAKFQEDRSISFWVIVFTALRKVHFEKNAFKVWEKNSNKKSCFLSYSLIHLCQVHTLKSHLLGCLEHLFVAASGNLTSFSLFFSFFVRSANSYSNHTFFCENGHISINFAQINLKFCTDTFET